MRTIIITLLVLLAAQSAAAQVQSSKIALSGPLHYLEDPVLIPLLPSEEAAAQNPVVLVLGVGNLVMEVPLPVATAQAQTYYAYIDDRAKQTLTVTCTLKSGQTAVSLCPTPLSAMSSARSALAPISSDSPAGLPSTIPGSTALITAIPTTTAEIVVTRKNETVRRARRPRSRPPPATPTITDEQISGTMSIFRPLTKSVPRKS